MRLCFLKYKTLANVARGGGTGTASAMPEQSALQRSVNITLEPAAFYSGK
jgi:hypothetical protein